MLVMLICVSCRFRDGKSASSLLLQTITRLITSHSQVFHSVSTAFTAIAIRLPFRVPSMGFADPLLKCHGSSTDSSKAFYWGFDGATMGVGRETLLESFGSGSVFEALVYCVEAYDVYHV